MPHIGTIVVLTGGKLIEFYFLYLIYVIYFPVMTHGLASASKYWTYRSHTGDIDPVSLVACHQLMLAFAPTASLVGLGEKLGTDPRIGQPSHCGLCREPFFLGAVALLNSIDDYAKGCYTQTMWDMYGRGPYADRAWKTCGILVGFPL
jgi:hypothetical protein